MKSAYDSRLDAILLEVRKIRNKQVTIAKLEQKISRLEAQVKIHRNAKSRLRLTQLKNARLQDQIQQLRIQNRELHQLLEDENKQLLKLG